MSGQQEAADGTAGRERRQLALVALGILALLVAAFLAPPAVPGGGGGDGDGGGSTGGGDGEPIGEPQGGTPEEIRTVSGEGDGNWRFVTRDELTEMVVADDCVVALLDRPVPGRNVTVSVWNDAEPVPDVAVSFNGERIGRTDADGLVSGRVPYQRELVVSVSPKPADDCEFVRARVDDTNVGTDSEDAAGAVAPGATTSRGGALSGAAPAGPATGAVAAPIAAADTPTAANNTSERVEVTGEVNVQVRGDLYPGERVTVAADVEGVPMRAAAVEVDGDRVGETDDAGTRNVTLPEGQDQVTVRVARGDFAGEALVDVRLLRLGVQPRDLFPLPGEPATVRTVVNNQPVANATVTLDGETVGRTDVNGTAGLTLPADPDATVTAATERQTASHSLWWVYAPTIGAVAVLLLASTTTVGVAHRRSGRRRAQTVALAWLVVGAVFVLWLLFEGVGLGAGLLFALLLGALYHRRRVARGAATAASGVSGFVAWCLRAGLWLARALERLLRWFAALLGRFRRWLGTLPASASGLWARFSAWLVGLPGRIYGRVAPLVRPRLIGAAVGAIAVVAAATWLGGWYGTVAAIAVLVLAAAALWWRRRTPETDDEGDEADAEEAIARTERTTAAAGDDEESRPSLRELWRRFARHVDPRGWHHRTPGEIAREARRNGYPREPVEALTDAFRDVEYGDRTLSPERDARVRDAFERVIAERDEEAQR